MSNRSPVDLDEYSPNATLVHFDRPRPLLRGPVPAATSDDPSSGPFVLAFKDPQFWASAYRACESQIIQQCEAGARIGCSISASNKCRPPWWKAVVGLSKQDFAQRAQCEEREMAICLEASREKCRGFAKDKCSPVFRDARIAVNGLNRKVNWKEVSKLISWASLPNKSCGIELFRLGKSWIESKCQFEVTNIRGSDLLSTDDISVEDLATGNTKNW